MSVQLCSLVQLPTVAIAIGCPGACIAGHCELPDMDAGMEFRSSAKIVSVLSHRNIFLDPQYVSFYQSQYCFQMITLLSTL